MPETPTLETQTVRRISPLEMSVQSFVERVKLTVLVQLMVVTMVVC